MATHRVEGLSGGGDRVVIVTDMALTAGLKDHTRRPPAVEDRIVHDFRPWSWCQISIARQYAAGRAPQRLTRPVSLAASANMVTFYAVVMMLRYAAAADRTTARDLTKSTRDSQAQCTKLYNYWCARTSAHARQIVKRLARLNCRDVPACSFDRPDDSGTVSLHKVRASNSVSLATLR